RKGEGLTDLPLMPQATRPVMSRHHTGIAVLLAPSGQAMLERGFPREGTPCAPLDPPLLRGFLHLSLAHPVRPAEASRGRSAVGLGTGARGTPSTCLQDRSLITAVGSGKDGGPMPRAETPRRLVHHGCGLLMGAFADDPAHDQCASGRHCGVVPQSPCQVGLMVLAALRLLFTKRHGASNSSALGVSPCTC